MLRRLLFLAVGGALSVLGCSSPNSSGRSAPQRTSHDGSDAGASGAIRIQLNGGVGLSFTTGTPQSVPVQVDPPAVYPVSFSLTGDAADAFLDKSQDQTDEDGKTSVLLTPPSSEVLFRLRASVRDATAELPVSSSANVTTVDVVPVYGGKRAVSSWIASAGTDGRCDPDSPVPLADDAKHIGQATAGPNESVPVPNVPVGAPLRVTVRAGHFAGGCTEVPAFQAGERRSVSVTVTDRPLQMNGVSMPVALGLNDNDAVASAWSKLAATMTASALSSSKSDAGALLDAMDLAMPYLSQDAFSLARTVHDWDARVNGVLAAGGGATAIRATLPRWITGARTTLSKQMLTGTLTSPDSGSGAATLAVTSIGGASPGDVGFPSSMSMTWTSAPSDQVLFGGSGSWQPSRLAAAIAQATATKEVPSASSVPAALANVLSCDDVAAAIAQDAAEVLILACDAACLSSRCESALTSMWAKARDAVVTRGAVHIAVSGAASIDDTAHPNGVSGSWVGDASFGSGSTGLTGSVGGATAAPAPQ